MTRDEYIAELRAAANKLQSADARASAHARIDELLGLEERAGPPLASPPAASQRSLDERLRELETLSAEVAEKAESVMRSRSRGTRSRTEESILRAIYILAVIALAVIIIRAWGSL